MNSSSFTQPRVRNFDHLPVQTHLIQWEALDVVEVGWDAVHEGGEPVVVEGLGCNSIDILGVALNLSLIMFAVLRHI